MNNNKKLRELFTLPAIQYSTGTQLVVPSMPPQQSITGDKEVDAVLWLQQVVKTGNQALIDKALEAAKQIKTPMKELGDRYAAHIKRDQPDSFFAVLFATMGFGELEKQAQDAIRTASFRHEALARFGNEETLFKELPAERQCRLALKRKEPNDFGYIDDEVARPGFESRLHLVPSSIDDCLHIIGFWNHLYELRKSMCSDDRYYENTLEANAHEYYAFFMLSEVPIRSKNDAIAAFDQTQDDSCADRKETPLILRHLITSGWKAKEVSQ